MADDVLKGLLYALHDSLMLLAPGGWTSVTLRFAGGRLTEVQTRGDGAKAPRPKPDLAVDPELEAHRLSQGVAELSHLLEHQGRHWTPGSIAVDRSDDFSDWKLIGPDGSTAWFTRLLRDELDALLVTDALFAALSGTERAFADLQAALDAKLAGYPQWRYDGRVLTLERGKASLELPAQLVGRYAAGSFTWSWGWAEPGVEPHSVDRVREICAPAARQAGLSAFWRERYQCDEGFAWALASHLSIAIGARGLYRGELPDGSSLVLAVMLPANAS